MSALVREREHTEAEWVDEFLADLGRREQVISDVQGALARNPENVANFRRQPDLWIDAFCHGLDFEAQPVPREFHVSLWPWQGRYVRHLAGIESYNASTPFALVDGRQRYIELKARGVGATWTNIWFACWALWAMAPAQILLMSDVETKAIDLLSRVDYVVRHLPPSLGLEYQKGGDSKLSKVFTNGSEIHSLSGNPERIRSYHPYLTLIDEVAQLQADPTAAILGLSGIVVLLSTAQGYGNPFERIWTDAADNGGKRYGFVPIFLSWREIPHLTSRPLGDPRLQKQEYPNDATEAFLTSGRPYFDLNACEELRQRHVREPIETRDNGQLRIFERPEAGQVYILAADVAEGKQAEEAGGDPEDEHGGPDYSYCVVRKWDRPGEEVASWHGRLPEIPFAHVLFALWKEYPGIIVPERNNSGAVVAIRLQELYPSCVYYDPSDGRPGWITTAESRATMLQALYETITHRELVARDVAFWNEMRRFRVQDTGKAEAGPGDHDDRVIAWAISQYLRQFPALRPTLTMIPGGGAQPQSLPPQGPPVAAWEKHLYNRYGGTR